jgi:hypothetical protein
MQIHGLPSVLCGILFCCINDDIIEVVSLDISEGGLLMQTMRTTLTLPAELLEAADRAVRTGHARSRNELVARALCHELAALERVAIDAAFATLGDDPDHLDEVRTLDMEFAAAEWEAFRQVEGVS